ncbi:hypothetical protein J6590_081378 [Homalodisca vitripennis]|nr:hypothetical protein J6590_081378 [Homalodisca vitripennis]
MMGEGVRTFAEKKGLRVPKYIKEKNKDWLSLYIVPGKLFEFESKLTELFVLACCVPFCHSGPSELQPTTISERSEALVLYFYNISSRPQRARTSTSNPRPSLSGLRPGPQRARTSTSNPRPSLSGLRHGCYISTISLQDHKEPTSTSNPRPSLSGLRPGCYISTISLQDQRARTSTSNPRPSLSGLRPGCYISTISLQDHKEPGPLLATHDHL